MVRREDGNGESSDENREAPMTNLDELTPRKIIELMSMAESDFHMDKLRHALVGAVRKQLAAEDAAAAAANGK